ncbi:unnamed protein product [Kluyveromyces dobzhanskii CBS 2104]|uniref:ER lumen protein-retaining receptor n=1 Tax=Kluyveromyces dobzhanskii CBS 2104 TaxID=1427455 RepID=A0A0A8L7W8_9SACH|nr:unnamed protein product [Kluyveromyces dobzhanskii CBS 2104]
MLNIFRIAGDFSHLASIIILIQSITTSNSVDGISLKTQLLYTLVFITRYLNILTKWTTLYNFLMKIIFISSSIYVVVLMRQQKFKNPVAYQDMITRDQFKIKFLIVPCILLGLIFNYRFNPIQICWSFSLWLESVAILPQLFMLTKTGKAKQLTSHYIFALGLYRTLYIPNWIWRYYTEERFDKLSVFTGIIQTAVYSDFFYIYYQKVIKLGGDLELPH